MTLNKLKRVFLLLFSHENLLFIEHGDNNRERGKRERDREMERERQRERERVRGRERESGKRGVSVKT